MGKFVMGNYLNNETKDLEISKPIERPVDDTGVDKVTQYENVPTKGHTKEIKLSSVKNTPISEIVAKALNEAFAITGLELIHEGELTTNSLFKDIKVISVEDINDDLPGSITALQESEVVFMDMKMPKTHQEKLFDLQVVENQNKVFNNPVKLAAYLNKTLKEQEGRDAHEDIKSFNVGDMVTLGGISHLVIFKDKYVMILREESQHRPSKETHKIIDM